MAIAVDRLRARPNNQIATMHRLRWSSTWIWLGLVAVFGLAEGLLVWSTISGWFVLSAAVVLLLAHLMHGHLTAFHDAAHGTLCPLGWGNELIGRFLGTLSFMSYSLYRAAHHTHHAYLATERDEELWPFVMPGCPRWLRRLAAALELSAGLFYTPCLFLRSFLRAGSPIRREEVRRRVWLDFAAMLAIWAGVLAAVAYWHLWIYLLLCYLLPAYLAGNMQSLRKYIEHMGLVGPAKQCTRSVAPAGLLGALYTLSLFNVSFHATHHKFPRLPEVSLPECATRVMPIPVSVFPSYFAAFREMLPTLRDPRIGPQWLRSDRP